MKKVITFLCVGMLTACGSPTDESSSKSEEISREPQAVVDATAALDIIQTRCATCHSATPTDDMFRAAPGNAMFDSLEQIQKLAPRIRARAVDAKTMPFMNKTQMTEQERSIVGQWIKAGAPSQ